MTWSLAFHMSRNALIRPFISYWGVIYWTIVKNWRRRILESKYIIAKICPILVCLSLHPFVLEEAISALSQPFPCLCDISIALRIELVEAQVEGFGFSIPTRCWKNLSFVSMFTLIEISISRPIACVIMNICIHGCN